MAPYLPQQRSASSFKFLQRLIAQFRELRVDRFHALDDGSGDDESVNHLWSAGTTYQGASSVAVARIISS